MDALARHARDRPDAPFLIRDGGAIDFATAAERVAGMAGTLRRRYAAGSRLAVVMHSDPETVLVALAVQAAGMVLIPLPARTPERELEVLAASVGAERLTEVKTAAGAPPISIDPDAPCAAVFTSGSTGTPRAVRLTWGNVAASARASAEHIGHTSEDRWLAVLPLHHVGGLSIVWRSVREGSAVILAGPFDATRTASVLAAGGATLGSFVGPMLEALADVGLDRAPGFRHGLVGGGPAGERALSVAGMSLLATYGMTETASQVATADPFDPDPNRLVPLSGVDIGIDPGGRISIAGPMVSPGDLDAPDRAGRLLTSDLGAMHEGRLQVLGRTDDVIVTGGENVMPAQVERALSRVPGAGSVAVVGLADPRWGAVVACAYTGDANADELVAAIRLELPPHAVPRRWKRIDELPQLGIGKVDRVAVARLFE